ncbi:hypothetical protein [Parasphingorhabdus halotolerans]|uniref:Uncharacterized protein n=1 Tax=Parasphingorhabdus halotolerans TaxID=2725558 RepID=A0A6H2DLZ3_9SPHN|nr:hypothetical protein [Parasphingorhabdus halotolerans]QJB69400.1 hypothetical protein HF685_08990 [Parasphingorhabdus halotolerans]
MGYAQAAQKTSFEAMLTPINAPPVSLWAQQNSGALAMIDWNSNRQETKPSLSPTQFSENHQYSS